MKSNLKSVPELKLIPHLASGVIITVALGAVLAWKPVRVEAPANTPCAAGAKAAQYSSTEELLVSKCKAAWM